MQTFSEMQNFKYQIHKIFRSCINCSYYRADDSLLCQKCQELLLSEAVFDKKERIYTIDVYYLLKWIPNESRLISLIVQNLKGQHFPEVYRFYAKLIALNMNLQADKKWVIVPCPSRSQDRWHARILAVEFSKVVGFPMIDCLSYSDDEEAQKKKSKRERMGLKIYNAQVLKLEHVIFIDDVVTTGSTFKASYLALGRPKEFVVGAIARRLLATEDLIW